MISTKSSSLEVINNYIQETNNWLEYLQTLPLLKYPKGKIFGKEITFHRSIGFFSDESIGYRFSGQTINNGGLTLKLKEILDKVNTDFSKDYNGILINVYYSGEDYISAHSDDEKELLRFCKYSKKMKMSEVMAISFGESRTFRVRPKDRNLLIEGEKSKRHKTPVYDIATGNGQLIIMKGEFQKEFTHEIPPEKDKKGIRVSLTFRYHSK